ncbi:hypothetical protein RF11_05848 [Thelohanellus kitauei]|uniref:Uncharacterized protein n=1 Tax=Thelohanellus kitauei TaxID=669202 RepID=A0A0C2I7F7_THEKT|nr:hypothetical protein RF11_05848 [Thelohanellus kitauei]
MLRIRFIEQNCSSQDGKNRLRYELTAKNVYTVILALFQALNETTDIKDCTVADPSKMNLRILRNQTRIAVNVINERHTVESIAGYVGNGVYLNGITMAENGEYYTNDSP